MCQARGKVSLNFYVHKEFNEIHTYMNSSSDWHIGIFHENLAPTGGRFYADTQVSHWEHRGRFT